MSQRLLLGLVIALAATVIGLTLFWHPQTAAPPTHPADNPWAPTGGDFVLTSADGPFDTASLRGKVVLIYFGYTYCPDICPTSLTAISQALQQLTPAELERVKTVFVSVDPERDTPARLKDYVAFFHPSMVGVTGSPEQIAAVAQRYGALYARQDPGSSAGYAVDHSAWTYIVAPDGRLVGQLTHDTSIEPLLAAIRKRLAASAADSVTVVDPYVRLVPPAAMATAAFMVLKNGGDKDVKLIKADNSIAKVAELHTHLHEGGMMKMRQVAAIEIKAKGEAVLQPSGLHIMLIDIKNPLKEGDKVALTLGFDDGSIKRIEAPVRKPAPIGQH